MTARSGIEGIEKATRELPDTILLDIKMPEMDGYEVCRRLKTNHATKDIPVLMVSAVRRDSLDLVKGLDSGADAYLTKPIDDHVLIAQINTALRTKNAEDQLKNQKKLLERMVQERTAELQQTNEHLKSEIEEHKATERRLRESESKLIQAQYISKSGDYCFDIQTEEVTFSKGMYKILQYDPDEPFNLKRVREELHHPEDSEQVFQWFDKAIRARETTLPPNEYRIRRKDGSIIYVRTEGRIEYKNGKAAKIFNICQDITERKKIDQELQKMQRLESLGTLAGGIAHDFNNILMGLFGNLALAKEKIPDNHPGFPFLKQAEQSMARATRLTKQLLTFAKGGTPIREDVGITSLADEVIRFDLAGSNVKPVFHHEPGLWQANVDKGQMQQVFSNLAINADQAMPDGGHLYITMENADVPPNTIPSLDQGQYIKISIQDQGTGIAPKHLNRVFDPYFSTKQTGSGLGLATVYSIMTRHKGCILVDSELGKGTVFTLYLPASQKNRPEQPSIQPQPSQTGQADRILVVDDEKMILEVVTAMLKSLGYEVATSCDGKEAAAKYKHAMDVGEPFRAVILDITIPGGMGGQEAIKNILEIDPDAVGIVSSGYADDPIMAHYTKYGFKGMVPKPYSIKELQDILARIP